jgi:hypothetical protein
VRSIVHREATSPNRMGRVAGETGSRVPTFLDRPLEGSSRQHDRKEKILDLVPKRAIERTDPESKSGGRNIDSQLS